MSCTVANCITCNEARLSHAYTSNQLASVEQMVRPRVIYASPKRCLPCPYKRPVSHAYGGSMNCPKGFEKVAPFLAIDNLKPFISKELEASTYPTNEG